jgi:hypothetical protein
MEEGAFPDEAISSKQGIASGKEQVRPRNDMDGNWSDYETMMYNKLKSILYQ